MRLRVFFQASAATGQSLLAFFGGPLREGMASLSIFGLLIAAVLTLLVLPAF